METYYINPFLDLLVRLTLNMVVTWIVAMGLFYHFSKKKTLVFCLFIFNLLIFIVGYLLSNTEISAGAGLGLFAVFTMLRYRSETLNLREMTYLFIIIIVGLINSTGGMHNFGSMAFLDFVILALVYFLEKYVGGKILSTEKIKYNNMELLKPQYRHLLLQDIFIKTGFRVKSVDIESINISDKSAMLTIYYDEIEYVKSFDGLPDPHELLPEPDNSYDRRNGKKTFRNGTILRMLR